MWYVLGLRQALDQVSYEIGLGVLGIDGTYQAKCALYLPDLSYYLVFSGALVATADFAF